MASWPETTRVIGSRIPRLDGMAKASGKAKYPSDVRPEGTLFGVMLYSPHAHAKVKSIDISAAEKMPGVKAVIAIAQAGTTLRFHGDDIAAVAAETENQARDAIRAIKVEYEVLPHVATEALSMADGAPENFRGGNVRKGRARSGASPTEAMATAEVTIEGTYSVPMITHVCLESHGLTVKFEGDDKIVCWASTQNVTGVANDLAGLVQDSPGQRDGVYRLHGGRLRLEVRCRHLGQDRGPALQDGRRTARQDVPGPGAGAPGGGQPAQRLGPHQAGREPRRHARRLDRRGTGRGGVGGGADVILPYVY